MAVPTNARILRGFPLKAGVMLGISPSSDPTFDVELARATSSGVYATIGRLTPKGSGIPVSYTDLLPVDNATWYYKARAVKDGWEAGDYTTAISGKAVILPEIAPNITPLTGKSLGVPLYISTGGGGVPFGQPASAAAYTKTLRIPAADFIGQNENQTFTLQNGELFTNSTAGSSGSPHLYTAPVTVPWGAEVTAFGFLGYRGTTAAFVLVSLNSHTTAGAVAGTNLIATGSSYVLAATTIAVPLTASSVRSIYAQLNLANNSATLSNARLVWVDITYGTPSLQASL